MAWPALPKRSAGRGRETYALLAPSTPTTQHSIAAHVCARSFGHVCNMMAAQHMYYNFWWSYEGGQLLDLVRAAKYTFHVYTQTVSTT